jgi:hypothetical protein
LPRKFLSRFSSYDWLVGFSLVPIVSNVLKQEETRVFPTYFLPVFGCLSQLYFSIFVTPSPRASKPNLSVDVKDFRGIKRLLTRSKFVRQPFSSPLLPDRPKHILPFEYPMNELRPSKQTFIPRSLTSTPIFVASALGEGVAINGIGAGKEETAPVFSFCLRRGLS